VTDWLRLLLDRPLDPLAARAVVVLATAVSLGFAAVFVLGVSERDRPMSSHEDIGSPRVTAAVVDEIAPKPKRRSPRRRQDPQDERDSAAAGRATRTLRSHRALQHVPYRDREVTIALAGARVGRAILRVSASTISEARNGWHRFLWRYRDSGRAYIPVFKAPGSERPRGGA
jgi:hypothetical protein